jgi:transcription elongation factor GreA
MEKEYITKERKEALEQELQELQTTERKKILEALEFAKSLGDLSENAEYHQARENQGKLEDRIREITHVLANSQVMKKHKKSDIVEVGSTVVVQKVGSKDKKTFELVGAEDADMTNGRLSYRSPLGEGAAGAPFSFKYKINTLYLRYYGFYTRTKTSTFGKARTFTRGWC